MTAFERVQIAAEYIQGQLGDDFPFPKVGFVLGSGLGTFADAIDARVAIPYGDIPEFPVSSVSGHSGRLVVGTLNGTPVAAMQGRVHKYEGYSWEEVIRPVRTLGLLGVKVLVLTNAAGGIDPSFKPGTLMLITDHINLTGSNPLAGPNDDQLGPRFPDMSTCYHPEVMQALRQSAAQENIPLAQGVYAAQLGPTYETPAEIHMASVLGAQAVGMSTVPEAIAANHLHKDKYGVKVGGVSCITNLAAGISPHALSHEEVKETADRVKGIFSALLRTALPLLAKVAE